MAFAPAAAFDYLRRAYGSDRLGHAYLLVGGRSAMDLAAQIAGLTVGNAGDPLAHPDVHLIEPESKSRRIVIEQIRDLEGALRLRASRDGGRKVGIIRDADRLQIQASNAFLKTLEEPPAQSLLLLLSAHPESLPDTIVSRCIRVTLLDGAAPERTPEEAALVELLAGYAADRARGVPPSLPIAYGLTREFTVLLGAVRARVQEEQEAALERERKQYGQTTDGSWLGEREGYYKALTEARYVDERARLVELLARWWGDVLRVGAAGGAPEALPGAGELAGAIAPAEILRKLARIDDLRENMDRNIQEALALEVAFLRVFGE